MSEVLRVSPTTLMFDLLRAAFPDLVGKVGVELPNSGQPVTGEFYVQVFHFGGEADIFGQEPTIDVSTFHRSWKTTEQRAFAIEQAFLRYPMKVSSGGRAVLIDRIYITASASELPWEADPGVTRFNSTVQLVLRG